MLTLVSALGQESAWPYQQQTGCFYLHSDSPLDESRQWLVDMQRLPAEFQNSLCLAPKSQKIHVVLLKSETEYQRYIQHYFPTVPARRALFIKDRGPGIVFAFRHPELVVDLRHECSHALLQDQMDYVPLWLDEGLAEYYESLDGTGHCWHPTHAPIIQWQARLGHVPTLEELERFDDPKDMDARRYSESWAWVHFMIEGSEEGKILLQGYLKDLAENGRRAGSLSNRIRIGIPNYRRRFLDHFNKLKDARPDPMIAMAGQFEPAPTSSSTGSPTDDKKEIDRDFLAMPLQFLTDR